MKSTTKNLAEFSMNELSIKNDDIDSTVKKRTLRNKNIYSINSTPYSHKRRNFLKYNQFLPELKDDVDFPLVFQDLVYNQIESNAHYSPRHIKEDIFQESFLLYRSLFKSNMEISNSTLENRIKHYKTILSKKIKNGSLKFSISDKALSKPLSFDEELGNFGDNFKDNNSNSINFINNNLNLDLNQEEIYKLAASQINIHINKVSNKEIKKIIIKYFQGYSVSEIAKCLNFSKTIITKTLNRIISFVHTENNHK